MDKFYAGIGSRSVPLDIQLLMYDIAAFIGRKYILRSGHALGSDLAFENGCDSVIARKEIYVAEDCSKEAMEYSSSFHPAWDKCSPYVRKLHGRNAMILLGQDLKTPVERVICYTQDGKFSGGTGQGLRIAESNDIKIYNLYFEDIRKKFYDMIYWGNK